MVDPPVILEWFECREDSLIHLILRIEGGVIEYELRHLEEVVLESPEVCVEGRENDIFVWFYLLTQIF